MLAFLLAVGFVAFFSVIYALRGWVLSVLWGWFVVPTLGLPPIGVAQAIGLALVVGVLTHQYVPAKDGDHGAIWFAIVAPLWFLFIGWVVRGFS